MTSVGKFNIDNVKVELTDNAREHLVKHLASHQDKNIIRFTVSKTGCSGFAYEVELVETMALDDVDLSKALQMPICMDRKAVAFLNGMTVDYVKQDLGQSKLVYCNPNATGACGCGESFTIEEKNK